MAFVMSPSNMKSFADCPLRFYGSSISKEIPWMDSPQKARGTAIHAALEKAAHKGWQGDPAYDDKMDVGYAKAVVQTIQSHKSRGYKLFTEHEMAMTKQGKACSWWDGAAFLRAKADVLLLPKHDWQPLIIGDWKTGRIWDKENFQLRVEALLTHILYGAKKVKYAYWYVDQGQPVQDEIDFSKGLADVQDIYDLMQDMRLALRDNNFPAKKNKFCKWCPWEGTEKCK